MAVILDFQSEQFKLILIYKSSRCFLPSFKSIGLLVQEKKWKIDFQDGGYCGHLGFPIGKILAIFGLQVTWMFPTKSIGLSVQERKWKIDFKNGGQLGFSMGKILASFDLQVIPMLLTKFQVNWLRFRRRKNRFFQDGLSCCCHLEFPIRPILAIFDLQVTLMLPTKFQVKWSFCSGEVKNRFSRWLPSWISHGEGFSYFWSTNLPPNAFYQVSSQLAFRFRRRSKK